MLHPLQLFDLDVLAVDDAIASDAEGVSCTRLGEPASAGLDLITTGDHARRNALEDRIPAKVEGGMVTGLLALADDPSGFLAVAAEVDCSVHVPLAELELVAPQIGVR